MVSQGVTSSMLLLRIIALAASVATIVLMVTDNAKYKDDFVEIDSVKFKDFVAFRYVVAVAAISAAYGIIQLPFALYYAVKQKKLIRNGCLPDFDFIGDKVISLLLATGIGAGIGVAYEAKLSFKDDNFSSEPDIDKSLADQLNSKFNKFYDRAIIASSLWPAFAWPSSLSFPPLIEAEAEEAFSTDELISFITFLSYVISLVLATAIGAGIGVSYESKRAFEQSKDRHLSRAPASD